MKSSFCAAEISRKLISIVSILCLAPASAVAQNGGNPGAAAGQNGQQQGATQTLQVGADTVHKAVRDIYRRKAQKLTGPKTVGGVAYDSDTISRAIATRDVYVNQLKKFISMISDLAHQTVAEKDAQIKKLTALVPQVEAAYLVKASSGQVAYDPSAQTNLKTLADTLDQVGNKPVAEWVRSVAKLDGVARDQAADKVIQETIDANPLLGVSDPGFLGTNFHTYLATLIGSFGNWTASPKDLRDAYDKYLQFALQQSYDEINRVNDFTNFEQFTEFFKPQYVRARVFAANLFGPGELANFEEFARLYNQNLGAEEEANRLTLAIVVGGIAIVAIVAAPLAGAALGLGGVGTADVAAVVATGEAAGSALNAGAITIQLVWDGKEYVAVSQELSHVEKGATVLGQEHVQGLRDKQMGAAGQVGLDVVFAVVSAEDFKAAIDRAAAAEAKAASALPGATSSGPPGMPAAGTKVATEPATAASAGTGGVAMTPAEIERLKTKWFETRQSVLQDGLAADAERAKSLGMDPTKVDEIVAEGHANVENASQPPLKLQALAEADDTLVAEMFKMQNPGAEIISKPDDLVNLGSVKSKATLQAQGKPQIWTPDEAKMLKELSLRGDLGNVYELKDPFFFGDSGPDSLAGGMPDYFGKPNEPFHEPGYTHAFTPEDINNIKTAAMTDLVTDVRGANGEVNWASVQKANQVPQLTPSELDSLPTSTFDQLPSDVQQAIVQRLTQDIKAQGAAAETLGAGGGAPGTGTEKYGAGEAPPQPSPPSEAHNTEVLKRNENPNAQNQPNGPERTQILKPGEIRNVQNQGRVPPVTRGNNGAVVWSELRPDQAYQLTANDLNRLSKEAYDDLSFGVQRGIQKRLADLGEPPRYGTSPIRNGAAPASGNLELTQGKAGERVTGMGARDAKAFQQKLKIGDFKNPGMVEGLTPEELKRVDINDVNALPQGPVKQAFTDELKKQGLWPTANPAGASTGAGAAAGQTPPNVTPAAGAILKAESSGDQPAPEKKKTAGNGSVGMNVQPANGPSFAAANPSGNSGVVLAGGGSALPGTSTLPGQSMSWGQTSILVPNPQTLTAPYNPSSTSSFTPEVAFRGFVGASIVNGNAPSTAGFDGAVLFPLGDRVLLGPMARFQWVDRSIVATVGSHQAGSTFIDTRVAFNEGDFEASLAFPFGGWQIGVQGGATLASASITQAEGFCGGTTPTGSSSTICTVTSSTNTNATIVGPSVGGYVSHSLFSHAGVFVEYDWSHLNDTTSSGSSGTTSSSSTGSSAVFNVNNNSLTVGFDFTFGGHPAK